MTSPRFAWIARPATWWVAVIVWSLGLTSWLSWPVLIRPGEAALGNLHADGMKHLWTLWWMRESVWTEGHLPFETTLVNHPYGMDLYPIEPLNGLFAIALPSLDIVVLSNLLVFINVTLTGIAGAWFGRVLSGSRLGGLVAGTLLQGSAVMAFFVHVGVGELTHLWWMPLGLGVLVRARRTLRWPWFLALAGCLIGAMFSCFYIGFFLAASVGLWALLTLWAGRSTPKLLALYVAAAGLAIAVVVPVTEAFSSSYKTGEVPEVGLESYVLEEHGQPVTDPPSARLEPMQLIDHGREASRREEAAYGGGRYLGVLPLVLALVGLVRRPKHALPFIAVGGVGVMLALGTYLVEGGAEVIVGGGGRIRLPLLWLNRLLGYLAEPLNFPTRFLAMTVTAVAGMASLALRPGGRRWQLGLLVLAPLAVGEVATGDLVPWPWDRFAPRDASALEVLRDAGDGAMIDVALLVRPDHENRWSALSTQIAHGKATQAVPIERIEFFAREGYVYVGTRKLLRDLQPIYENDRTASLEGSYVDDVAVLRDAGFRWILVSYRSGNEAVPAHIVGELTKFAGPPVAQGRGLAVWELPESTASAELTGTWSEQHDIWTLNNVEQYGRQQGPPLQ